MRDQVAPGTRCSQGLPTKFGVNWNGVWMTKSPCTLPLTHCGHVQWGPVPPRVCSPKTSSGPPDWGRCPPSSPPPTRGPEFPTARAAPMLHLTQPNASSISVCGALKSSGRGAGPEDVPVTQENPPGSSSCSPQEAAGSSSPVWSGAVGFPTARPVKSLRVWEILPVLDNFHHVSLFKTSGVKMGSEITHL